MRSGSCSDHAHARNAYELEHIHIRRNDEWTVQKQKRKTELLQATRTTTESLFNFGGKDCTFAVRAKFQRKPLKSSCRPTLKVDILPLYTKAMP